MILVLPMLDMFKRYSTNINDNNNNERQTVGKGGCVAEPRLVQDRLLELNVLLRPAHANSLLNAQGSYGLEAAFAFLLRAGQRL